MVVPAAGSVVVVSFPFSDLSQAKPRPAVVLTDAGRGDWILCQVTSNPYGDARAIMLADAGFRTGFLRVAKLCAPWQVVHGLPRPYDGTGWPSKRRILGRDH